MDLKKELIHKVQKERGRGNMNLHAYSKPGSSDNVEWVFPAKPGNKEYEIVQEWLRDGNIILDPPPKNTGRSSKDLVYREHFECHLPGNESLSIWRYIDFPKFLSLLDKHAIFFSRASNIIIHDDPYEGAFPKSSTTMFGELSKFMKEKSSDEKYSDIIGKFEIGKQVFGHLFKDQVLINCWNMKEYEDANMWARFGKDTISIAIKSDLRRLKNCFKQYIDYDIFIGQISYIDYETEKIVERSPLTPFLYKRKHFDSENEVRCFLYDDGDIGLFPDNEPMPVNALDEGLALNPGVYVPVDLDILIERIYVSHNSPEWVREMIDSLLNKLSVPPKEILFSSLREIPNI